MIDVRHRFPEPKRLFLKLDSAGIKTVANVKPWLLEDHPYYSQAHEERCFIWDKEVIRPVKHRYRPQR